MSSDTLNILTMIGTWVSGIGAFSAVMFALHSNKPRLNIAFREQSKLEVLNQRPVNAHISHIYHEIDGIPKRAFGSFSPYQILLGHGCRENEPLDKTVISGDLSMIHLNFDELYKAYVKQCNYSKIDVPQQMPRMYICVRLVSGKIYKLEVPISFYKAVRHKNIYKSELDILSLTSPRKERYYSTDSIRYQHCSQTLEHYMLSYKADMLWSLPKSKSLTKRLRRTPNAWRL